MMDRHEIEDQAMAAQSFAATICDQDAELSRLRAELDTAKSREAYLDQVCRLNSDGAATANQRAKNAEDALAAERAKYTDCSTALDLAIAERDKYADDLQWAEGQRDALAAALVDLQDAANKLLDLRDGNPTYFTTKVERAWDELRGILIDLTSGAVRSLGYRDKDQRRKGAAGALRFAARRAGEMVSIDGNMCLTCSELESLAAAIERGKVEVNCE